MGGKETYSHAPEIRARPPVHGRPGDVREPVPVDVDAVAVLVELEDDLFCRQQAILPEARCVSSNLSVR